MRTGRVEAGVIFAKVAKIDGHTVTPPPEEPQTAAPESPTVSGHRIMSTAHSGCLLASEQQQTGSVEVRCPSFPLVKNCQTKIALAFALPPCPYLLMPDARIFSHEVLAKSAESGV